jgi:hypothetical protein
VPERPVGVEDKSVGAPAIVDYRVRDRTVSAVNVSEQYLIRRRERVESSVAVYTTRLNVNRNADATTAWRWMILNPTGSGVTVALRDLEVVAMQILNAVVTPEGLLFSLERWTAGGTATGGTQVTAAKSSSGQAQVARVYTAPPTGLTTAVVATAWRYFPPVNFDVTSTNPRAHWPLVQDYHTTDPTLELAPAEALVFRQTESGANNVTTDRQMLCNITLEEFTRP